MAPWKMFPFGSEKIRSRSGGCTHTKVTCQTMFVGTKVKVTPSSKIINREHVVSDDGVLETRRELVDD